LDGEGCNECGEDEAPKIPNPSEDAAEVVSRRGEDDVGGGSGATFEIAAAERRRHAPPAGAGQQQLQSAAEPLAPVAQVRALVREGVLEELLAGEVPETGRGPSARTPRRRIARKCSAAASPPMQTRNHASRFEGIPKTESQGYDA
jgi:hypothetical protein